MKCNKLFLASMSSILFCICFTAVAEENDSVTVAEARSLVSTFIGDRAWEIESDPKSSSTSYKNETFFYFWVTIDPESNEKMNFYVRRTTGDIYESPGGSVVQTKAVLDKVRESRIPAEYEDSIWLTNSEDESSSTLTLTSKTITVEYKSLFIVGSVVRYSKEDQQIFVKWNSLYNGTNDTVTDLAINGCFRIERDNYNTFVMVKSFDAETDISLNLIKNLEWKKVDGERPNL
jgi:hypothetical protein